MWNSDGVLYYLPAPPVPFNPDKKGIVKYPKNKALYPVPTKQRHPILHQKSLLIVTTGPS
ncbi:unnamed protein product, partial [Nesidiocoris tenuis]